MITRQIPIVNPYSQGPQKINSEINNLKFTDMQQKLSYLRLPFTIRAWAYNEQANNPKAYDPDFYPKPSETNLPTRYMPENRSILQLESWIVPDNLLDGISTDNNQFDKIFNNNNGTHTLLVHPSMSNHQLFINMGARLSSDAYFFIPLASPRTGITWKLGDEQNAFISKMSIRPTQDQTKQIAQAKADLGTEGKMSVAKTACLEQANPDYNNNYFLDQYSLQLNQNYTQSTQEQSSYGVLYRSIPDYIFNSTTTNIPFFALASQKNKPLISSLIEKSGYSIEEFLKYYIFKPVASFILQNTKTGIYPEHLHGQNLLIKAEIGYKNNHGIKQLIPEIIYRDIADLKISRNSETQHLINFRTEQRGRECVFSPGSYAYEAAVQFLLCSAGPIIDAINTAQRQGFLPSSEYGHVDKNRLCLTFMGIILQNIQTELCSNNQDTKNYALSTLFEFASMANASNNIFKNTVRERQWQNRTTTVSKLLYNNFQTIAQVDQARYSKLMEHIQDFNQDSSMKYIMIDQQRGITNNQNQFMPQTYQGNQQQFMTQVSQPVNFRQQIQTTPQTIQHFNTNILCPMQQEQYQTRFAGSFEP